MNIKYLAGIALFVVACGTSKNKEKDMKPTSTAVIPKAPEIMTGNLSVWMYSKDRKDSLESRMTYQFYSSTDKPFKTTVNQLIGDFIFTNTQFTDDKYVYKPLTHSYFHESLYQFEKSAKEALQESEFGHVYEVQTNNTITENLVGYVQLNTSAYSYTGGAHGNGFDAYYLVEEASGKIVKFIDLVNNPEAVNKIAEKYFKKAVELAPDANLEVEGYWFENGKFACNDNFYIDSKGITFLFNAYEIAPYSYGVSSFKIPLSELKGLLNVEFEFKK
jgi:hypothetical protein